jgi:hypothetical protein
MSQHVKNTLDNSISAHNPAKPQTATRDDRVLRETRWLAAFTIPFSIGAFYVLYLRPNETQELWAWHIAAPMTSMMLASAYITAVYYFGRSLLSSRWHRIGLGLLPIAAFTTFEGVSTLLHLDRFNHAHYVFYLWCGLYFTTPFLLVAVWLSNRRYDPGVPEKIDYVLPAPVRYILGALGTASVLVTLVFFAQPEWMIALWPWPLTPLTARVVLGLFALLSVFELRAAIDARWSSIRLTLEAVFITMIFMLIAVGVTWETFDQSKVTTWIFLAALFAFILAAAGFYLYIERRLIERKELAAEI